MARRSITDGTGQIARQPVQTTQNNAVVKRNDASQIDLVDLGMRMLEKIHWILLSAFFAALLAGVYVFFLATPIYEATSKIYIVGSENAISLSDLQIGSNLAADYQEVFKNWHVHELVEQRLGLNYSYTELSKMITVTNPPSTHVLYIKAQSPDPEEAKALSDTYASVAREFIASRMDIREPNVFEEAQLPVRPVFPNKTRFIIIGFLLGATLAMAVVTVNYLSDDRIMNSDDIKKVGDLSTLGMVPLQKGLEDSSEETSMKQHRHKKNRAKEAANS